MKKALVLILAAALMFSMCTFAGEGGTEQQNDGQVTEQAAGQEAGQIEGYYVANYSEAGRQVVFALTAEPDLVAVAEKIATPVYYFSADGTARIYADGAVHTGTFTAEDGRLNINAGDISEEYEYEAVDNLLILHKDGEASVLYSFIIDDLSGITIEDYSTLEVDENSVTVTDELVDSYIDNILQNNVTTNQITEGTTKDGDIVTISFVGTLEGETEPFEGGTSEGITLQLGTGALIEGFEEQLVGKEIGTEFDVNITFADDYGNIEGLAGKNAVFAVTVDSVTEVIYPELTDEWVQEYSGRYLAETYETVDAFRTFVKGNLDKFYMQSAIMNALAAKATVSGYNQTAGSLLMNYAAQDIEYYASANGYDVDSYANALGYANAASYEEAEAKYYLNISMIVNTIMADKGLTYTQAELDEDIAGYLKAGGIQDKYTVEEYKTALGTVGLWIYTNEFKYDIAMSALEDNVVLVAAEEIQPETVKMAD